MEHPDPGQLGHDDLVALLRLARLLGSSLEPEEILRSIVVEVSRAVDVDRCSMVLAEETAGVGHVLASSDLPGAGELSVALPKYPEIVRVLEGKSPFVVPDVESEELLRPLHPLLRSLGIRSILVAPITADDEVVGTIVLRSLLRRRQFVPRDVTFCLAAADLASVALRNAGKYRALRERLLARERERVDADRLLDRIAELRRSEEVLLENERARTRFLSSAAHELKTPVTILKSYLETLMTDLAGGLSEEQTSLLEVAWDSSSRLERLVEDLLDLEALASGRLSLEMRPVYLEPLLERIVADHRNLARQADLTLALDLPGDRSAKVLADELRFEQILANMIGNALKYGRPGGEIRVSASFGGPRVRVAVADNGPGIAAEDQELVFEEFARLSGRRPRRGGGSGLGLALARRLAQAQGGTIGVDSVVGAGSTFWFTLLRAAI